MPPCQTERLASTVQESLCKHKCEKFVNSDNKANVQQRALFGLTALYATSGSLYVLEAGEHNIKNTTHWPTERQGSGSVFIKDIKNKGGVNIAEKCERRLNRERKDNAREKMLENDGIPEVAEPVWDMFKATYIKMSGSEVFIWIFLWNKKEQCLR